MKQRMRMKPRVSEKRLTERIREDPTDLALRDLRDARAELAEYKRLRRELTLAVRDLRAALLAHHTMDEDDPERLTHEIGCPGCVGLTDLLAATAHLVAEEK